MYQILPVFTIYHILFVNGYDFNKECQLFMVKGVYTCMGTCEHQLDCCQTIIPGGNQTPSCKCVGEKKGITFNCYDRPVSNDCAWNFDWTTGLVTCVNVRCTTPGHASPCCFTSVRTNHVGVTKRICECNEGSAKCQSSR